MFKIYDGREHFYQWDIDRKLIIEDPSVTEVHFTNRATNDAYVCATYVEDDKTLVNVPNILLQTNWRIQVYAYDGKHTKHDKCYEVKGRSKPVDYVYTETEVLSYASLEKEVEQLRDEMQVQDAKTNAIGNVLTTTNTMARDNQEAISAMETLIAKKVPEIESKTTFELIEEGTLTEDVNAIVPNLQGNKYKEIYCYFKVPPMADAASNTAEKGRFYVTDSGTTINNIVWDQQNWLVDNFTDVWEFSVHTKAFGKLCATKVWFYKYYATPYARTPVATDAFKESISPTIGMDAIISQFSFTSLLTPSPSLPITRPIEPVRLRSYICVPSISAHTNHIPFSFNSLMVWLMLVTFTTGV